jgi:hypothetical protein
MLKLCRWGFCEYFSLVQEAFITGVRIEGLAVCILEQRFRSCEARVRRTGNDFVVHSVCWLHPFVHTSLVNRGWRVETRF